MTAAFKTLLFLILKCIRIYDNYLYLVKIISLSEKSQVEEWWHFRDLQEPYTTHTHPHQLIYLSGQATDSPWEQDNQWADPNLITNKQSDLCITQKFHSNQYAMTLRGDEKSTPSTSCSPTSSPRDSHANLLLLLILCHLSAAGGKKGC